MRREVTRTGSTDDDRQQGMARVARTIARALIEATEADRTDVPETEERAS